MKDKVDPIIQKIIEEDFEAYMEGRPSYVEAVINPGSILAKPPALMCADCGSDDWDFSDYFAQPRLVNFLTCKCGGTVLINGLKAKKIQ